MTQQPTPQPEIPRPPVEATREEFGQALRNLRVWAGLKQRAFERGDVEPTTSDSTLSRYEKGAVLPTLEWVHAYVQRCLHHRWKPNASDIEVAAEYAHWRATWTGVHTRLQQAVTVVLEPLNTAPLSIPEPKPELEPAPVAAVPLSHAWAPTATAEPVQLRGRRPRGTCAAIGTAAAAVVAVILSVALSGSSAPTGATLGTIMPFGVGVSLSDVAVRASGHADQLRGSEGIDLDTGQRRPQTAPGVDVSFTAASTDLYAMGTRAKIALLPDTGPEDPALCSSVTTWVQRDPIPHVYDLTEGRRICVITDEGRYSMLTIIKRASAATKTIDIRYSTGH